MLCMHLFLMLVFGCVQREKIAEIKLEWTKMLSTAFARRKRAVTHQRKGLHCELEEWISCFELLIRFFTCCCALGGEYTSVFVCVMATSIL